MVDFDELEAEGVAPSIADWTFEQVLSSLETIPKEDQVILHWYAPDKKVTTVALKHLSKNSDYKFVSIARAAFIHGLAIIIDKHAETIALLETLEDTALTSGNFEFFNQNSNMTNFFLTGTKSRVPLCTTRSESDQVGTLSALLNTPKTLFVTSCIIASIMKSDLIPDTSKRHYEPIIKRFDFGVEVLKTIALKSM